MVNKSYFAVIPADVRYNKQLADGAKLLFGEITALCNEKGYCWASNAYFAELYDKSTDTISRWINQLKAESFLTVEINQSEGNTRKIFLTLSASLPRPIRKNADTYPQKSREAIRKNAEHNKDNNTVDNNTTNKEETTDVVSRPKRKTQIPNPFFLTTEMRTWGADHTPKLDLQYETLNFVDHFRNKGETGADWVAKWRNWMRNAFTDFGKYPGGKFGLDGLQRNGHKPTAAEVILNRDYSGVTLGEWE